MSTPQHFLIRGIIPLLLLIPMLFGSLVSPLSAQQDPRALDPADVFFQAWLEIQRAEKLEKAGKFSDAWQKYRQAANYYDVLSRFHKNWKPDLVQRRVQSTGESIKTIEPKVAGELADKKAKTRDLVESPPEPIPTPEIPTPKKPSRSKSTASGHERTTPKASLPITPRAPVIDPKLVARLRQLERENQTLRSQLQSKSTALSKSNAQSTALSTALSTAQKNSAQKNSAEQKRLITLIAKKDREINTLRDVLARAPLQHDMDLLTREKRTREHELNITARALKESRVKLAKAEQLVDKHRADADIAKKQAEKIAKDMKEQGNLNNHVIRELRKELKNVTTVLEQTRQELGKANALVAQMRIRLDESQTAIKELTQERDALRVERDSLASMLKKGDSKGVQNLIAENMRLGRELKEADDRVKFLETNHNTTKDKLVEARNDLTIAKARIVRYQQEHSDHGRIVKSLESQLHDAQTALRKANAKPSQNSNEEEIGILRATVKRLIAAQERRRMGEEILWETYQKSNVTIDGLTKAIQDIRKIKINLTDKERKFITTHRLPDGEFRNPERVPIAHARAHGDALQQEISYVEGLVMRHVEKGRIQAAHSILIDINERVPGNYRILCKLGIIEMKLGNFPNAIQSLDEAITMRENSGYAYYMLGVAQYKNKDPHSARNAFERSLVLKPENARAHLYLGNLAGAERRYQQAEGHFLSTIKIDPSLPDAYYNLSVLYLQQKRVKDALDYYRKALDHGAQPDHALERKLRS